MFNNNRYPSLYQVNTRIHLTELSHKLNRRATLDDIPDSFFKEISDNGFDIVWFLSVWTTGETGKRISRENPVWIAEFEKTLPDLKTEDIDGSGFSIANYHVSPALGGDEALMRLRERLKEHNLKLMLDFVPNHLGPDHRWVNEHHEYFVLGTEKNLADSPENYTKIGDRIFAFGRDPYFSGWTDTVQLDYSNPETVAAMQNELRRISQQCDGVRCDMSMLILPEVFQKTWHKTALPFWPEIIQEIHAGNPEFCFLAEVYWDMEWDMQQLGFNFTYDKRLYDRLREGNPVSVRQHFLADLSYQNKLARFLENHDEPRAASVFEPQVHKAAALLTFLSPGLKFFHDGQEEGKKVHVSPHLIRAPEETADKEISVFYDKLFNILKKPILRNGKWSLEECSPAWEGNNSYENFISFSWEDDSGNILMIVVNYSAKRSQCLLKIPLKENMKIEFPLIDILNDAVYLRNGNDISERGLYVDLPEWGTHVFEIKPATEKLS